MHFHFTDSISVGHHHFRARASCTQITLGPAYNEEKHAKETARCRWVFVVTELLNIAANDYAAKKSARYSRVLVVTELVISGTQCNHE